LLQLAVSLALGDNAEYHESLDLDILHYLPEEAAAANFQQKAVLVKTGRLFKPQAARKTRQ
jgi:hypothetical protein